MADTERKNKMLDVKPMNPEMTRYHVDEPLALQVLRAHGKEELWSKWEKEHQIIDSAERQGVLPDEEFFEDPFLLKDMAKAVDTLLPLIEQRAKILIHGDYDCDGITASSLLYRFLKHFAVNVDYYIPDRLSEGYGLSEAGVAHALSTKPAALITVDCGVQSFTEVEALEKAGIQVIITDHHVCLETLPVAQAVINPNRLDEAETYKMLAGAGVALKLCQALNSKLPEKAVWMQGLQYAALGTVADLMQLEGENRRIVLAGLLQLRQNPSAGMSALLELVNVKSEQVRARTLGFSIAPRINACGRMGSVAPVMDLMLSDDTKFCQEQVHYINDINQERRDVETRVFEEALLYLKNHPERLEANIIVTFGDDWHPGVLGIVASRLVQYFQRPAIVLSKESAELYKGSARSLGSIDILSCLQKCQAYLSHFGGHHAAAGLEIPVEQIENFSAALAACAEEIDLNSIDESIKYSLNLKLPELDLDLLSSLETLEPFGKGNEEPAFLVTGALLYEARAVGKESDHLRITLDEETVENRVNGIGFGKANLVPYLVLGEEVTVLAHLQRNSFRGQDSLDLLVIDLASESKMKASEDLSNELLRLQNMFPSWTAGQLAAPFAIDPKALLPTGETLREVYLNLLASGIERAPIILDSFGHEQLCSFQALSDPRFRLFVVLACLKIYEEAGLLTQLDWRKNKETKDLLRCYNLQKSTHKVNLYDTKTYRRLSKS